MYGNDLNEVHNLVEDKMAAIKFFTFATLVIGIISSTTAWKYIISRNSTQKLLNSVFDSVDKFNISECSGSVDDVCTTFGGMELQDKCQCICSQEKSTFGFYNDKWGCIENSIVRQHAACKYSLERPGSKGDRDPLFTLPVLGSHQDNNYVGNTPRNKNCTITAANATFLECDGTWGKLTESAMKRKLAFQVRAKGAVYIGPYQPSLPADPSLDGRVIRIPIQCEGLAWDPSQCVTFKIKGQLTCKNSSGSSGDIPKIITDEPTKTPTSSTETVTNGTTNIKKSKGDDTKPAAAVIAGSVVGGVAFVILIVVIVLMIIYWKRRKAKTKVKSVRRAQDNPAYEQGPDLSITLTRPTRPKSFRPLPIPPTQLPYEYLERGPSTAQNTNGIIPGSQGQGAYEQCNGEPLYGEIDETYSRLNHQALQPTRSTNSDFRSSNGPALGFPPNDPNKSNSLIRSDGSTGSGICNFEEYDVVGGQIKSSLPRGNTLKPPDGPNSLGRVSQDGTYDVPESMIRSSSKERPKNDILDNAKVSNEMHQPSQRDTQQKETYETVWEDDDDDNLVARIDLS